MLIRKTILAAAVLALAGSGTAFAQTVIFEPNDEVVIREYVVKQPPREVVIPDDYSVVVGEALPDTIQVTPLDAPGFEKDYEYVIIDGRTVLVDPETRRIVHVMD